MNEITPYNARDLEIVACAYFEAKPTIVSLVLKKGVFDT